MPLERINVYKYLDSGKQKAYPKSVADAIYVDDNEDKNIKEYIDEKIVSEINDKVPSWAQSETKPEYTAEEVGALPSTTEIPVIDDTLSITEQAADAKVVGDKFIEVDGNITNISESINKRISDIKTDLANTSDAIIGETEGKTILVNDSGKKGLSELNVYGWSKQSTTTGAQLFDIQKATTYDGVYGLTTSIDGENIKISGVASDIPGNNSVSFRILNYPENLYGNKFSMDIVDSTGAQGSYVYASQSENALAINFNTSLGAEVNLVFRLMVNSGSEALPWEPYTGGEASPSPDYPQEIVSAGDSGEINVAVSGKNLLDTTKGSLTVGQPYVFNGRTYLLNADGTVDITTQDATSATGTVYLNNSPIYLPHGEYTVSGNDTSIVVNVQIAASEDTNVRRISVSTGESKTFEIDSGEHIKYVWMYGDAGTEINGKVSAQIEIGTVATTYESYKTPQTLTLSTPGGLPGIPVDASKLPEGMEPTYVDESGQAWVCDEVDFERGVHVQRVIELDFDGAETWSTWGVNNLTEGITGFYSYISSGFQKMATNGMLSNLLQYASSAWGGGANGINVSTPNENQYIICSVYNDCLDDISTDDAAIESWKNILNTNNLHVMLILQDPIETDLPAEEITDYKALHTYTPNTTVSNDADAWMKVEYAKDIEQYIDEIKSYVDTNYVKKTDLETDQEKLEKYIEQYYALRRNGKVYQTKLWKFATNPTSEGEKLLSNAGLVFEPSTDTTEGQDDYLNGQHPMFEWVNVNYIRDDDGTARPIAIEGMDNYATSGSVDVGTMQMSFYWKWDTSNAEYDLITVSDSPHTELGLQPWPECVKQDGTILPWCIGSKYISGIASDGLLRSQPNLKPEAYQSHNNMITNYQLKGEGYWGSGAVRNLFQIVFNAIKGATKNSQTLYQGVTNWNFQYDASVERSTNETYFPVTNAQAESLIVGNCVEVGYGSNNNGTLNKDRGVATMRQYANNVKILSIETLDENNKAVYLDIDNGFTTTPIQLTDELSSPIIMSSMHCYSGMTDSVLGKHDGSPVSNTNAKYPYRVQGREYAVGGYVVASDVVMDFQSDYSKNVYVAEKGTAHSSSDNTIRSTYKMIGNIPVSSDGTGADWWVGDISVDMDTGTWFPSAIGSSNTQGYGDRCYAGGTSTSGTREYLQGGGLWDGSGAGSACLRCWSWLGGTSWNSLGCD